MPTLSELTTLIELHAPLSIQEPWDNSGLQIGDPNANISAAVVTLDVTIDALNTAIEHQANLIISHHPILIDPIRNITPDTMTGHILLMAAKHQIAIYSSHTAMDSAPNGINQWIADILTLQNVQPLTQNGLGRHGTLPSPISTSQFANLLKKTFNLPFLRTNAKPNDTISHIAICGGSGGSLIPEVLKTHADTYICGDLKYHSFQETTTIKLFDIGHFESENQFISIINSIISEKFPTFALHNINSNFTTII